jgi:hypothetical protein
MHDLCSVLHSEHNHLLIAPGVFMLKPRRAMLILNLTLVYMAMVHVCIIYTGKDVHVHLSIEHVSSNTAMSNKEHVHLGLLMQGVP